MSREPTVAETVMLELVNRARAAPSTEAALFGIDLNDGLSAGTISDTAKAPLAFNTNLIASSDTHSAWMLATGTFSHTGDGGSSAGDRMTAAGYSFNGSWTWGENISTAWATGPDSYLASRDDTTLITSAHEGLFKSSGHRTNILSEGFREIGIGQGVQTADGRQDHYVTQKFARSGSDLYITGVIFRDADGDAFYDAGEGVSGATLTLSNGTPVSAFASGAFTVPVSSAGTYTLTMSVAGEADRQSTVTIGTENIKVDFDLPTSSSADSGLAQVTRYFNGLNQAHYFTTTSGQSSGPAGYGYEGPGFQAMATTQADTTPVVVYRNTVTDSYLFTIDSAEQAALAANSAFETVGTAFHAYASQSDANMVPVYRYVNGGTGGHFFTASEAERAIVDSQFADAFSFEGIKFWAYPNGFEL